MAQPSLGNRTQQTFEPTKWATDQTCNKWPTTIYRQLRRLTEIGARYPRLGCAIAWGYYSLRLLRRLVEWLLPVGNGQSAIGTPTRYRVVVLTSSHPVNSDGLKEELQTAVPNFLV